MLPPEQMADMVRKLEMPEQERKDAYQWITHGIGGVKVRIGRKQTKGEKKQAGKISKKMDMSAIMNLAPFLDRDTLDDLVDGLVVEDLWQAISLAPFLSNETLDKLVMRCETDADMDALGSLVPFLSKETLRNLADRMRNGGNEMD